MSEIKEGATVKIHYQLTVDNETVDSSAGGEPLQYTHGSGQIIPGLESELVGLKAGDKKDVTVAPEQGYGQPTPEAVQVVPKESFQNADELQVGGIVQGQQGEQAFQAVVVKIADDGITLDFNHPLAGKTLNFSVEVVEVQ